MSCELAAAVDVVVVAYESADVLRACLSALPCAAAVVVVDNASGDASADVAAALGVRVVRNLENRGFAAAANQGACLGRRELILFLNPDAAIEERDLRALAGALDDRTAAVGPRLLRADGSEQRNWWPFPSPGATWREALGLSPRAGEGFVTGACLLIRRNDFLELGGFDERFWLYGEEADLCFRLWGRGRRVCLVPEATARHVGGASGARVDDLVFEHFQRGTEHFLAKHYGARGLMLHRLGLLVGTAVRLPLLARQRADGRFARRSAMVRRLVRLLITQPGRVPS